MSFHKMSAAVVILGSVFFLIAAFSPISRIFGEPSAVRKLEIILASPNQWLVAQLFFALGAVVTAIGVAMAAYHFRDRSFAVLIQVSVAMLIVGALLWSWHVYDRAADPAAFVERALSVYPFALYTLLTQAGLVLLGVALLRSELQNWVGWMLIGSMALFFVLTVIFRDMPPFVYYVITLVTGVTLYRSGTLATV